jgi:hypothetical protein
VNEAVEIDVAAKAWKDTASGSSMAIQLFPYVPAS